MAGNDRHPVGRFTDVWAHDLTWSIQVEQTLYSGRTEYQALEVFETASLGRVMSLDGNAQVAEADERGYHELIVHPGLCRAGAGHGPRSVLIIGGGDGGAAREALRHPDVGRVDLVDLDPGVTEAARQWLPTLWVLPDGSGPLEDDPRFHLHHGDGAAWVRDTTETYDLIVVDSTDPVGPGRVLFSDDFYAACARALSPTGAVAVQAGSWFFLPESLQLATTGLARAFETVLPYQCWSAIYPGGLWNLVMATKGDDPREVNAARVEGLGELDYYDAEVHRAAFVVPPAVTRVLTKAKGPKPDA